jgi:hypothetical protein
MTLAPERVPAANDLLRQVRSHPVDVLALAPAPAAVPPGARPTWLRTCRMK